MTTPTPTKPDGGAPAGEPQYRLRLYISGATPRSVEAVANIKAMCDTRLRGRFELEIVDAYQQPDLIRHDDIVVLPTLVRHLPLPLRRMVGDLSDAERVIVGLALVPDEASGPEPPEDIPDGPR